MTFEYWNIFIQSNDWVLVLHEFMEEERCKKSKVKFQLHRIFSFFEGVKYEALGKMFALLYTLPFFTTDWVFVKIEKSVRHSSWFKLVLNSDGPIYFHVKVRLDKLRSYQVFGPDQGIGVRVYRWVSKLSSKLF